MPAAPANIWVQPQETYQAHHTLPESPDSQNCAPNILSFYISTFCGNFLCSKKIIQNFSPYFRYNVCFQVDYVPPVLTSLHMRRPRCKEVRLHLRSFTARLVQEQVGNACKGLSQCSMHRNHTVKKDATTMSVIAMIII